MKSASSLSPIPADDVLAGRDLALVEPHTDQAVACEGAGQVAHKGLVFARMAEKNGEGGGEYATLKVPGKRPEGQGQTVVVAGDRGGYRTHDEYTKRILDAEEGHYRERASIRAELRRGIRLSAEEHRRERVRRKELEARPAEYELDEFRKSFQNWLDWTGRGGNGHEASL